MRSVKPTGLSGAATVVIGIVVGVILALILAGSLNYIAAVRRRLKRPEEAYAR